MPNPLFSIIIPTYNRADFVSKTICSLLQQSHTNFEIIVVDDGSTDNTEEVVKSIKDKRLFYYKKENAERGAARNYGAKKAKGEYLNFFDSDDIAYPNHLEEAVNVIQKYNNPTAFALGYELELKNKTRNITYKDINIQLIYGNLLSCNPVFIKRNIFYKFYFSNKIELSGSEDYLLWLQIASHFNVKHSNIITSRLCHHDHRSVLQINPQKLIKRKELMLKMALNDDGICTYYDKKLKCLKSNTYSYISLHLAMVKEKKQALLYLIKSLKTNLFFVCSKRFLVIIKHLFF